MAWTLWTWLGLCFLMSAFALVPPPENIHMHSVNFKSILRWKSPAFSGGNLTFRVQYHSYQKLFQDQCTSTNVTECDFSNLSNYGSYTLRIRSEFAAEQSDWVTLTFWPLAQTSVGPPEMKVVALANSLHVHLIAPQVENEPGGWTMKNVYNAWAYNLEYWKSNSSEKSLVTWEFDSEVLRDLEPFTTYCVRAQVFLPNWNRTGEWTLPFCERTKNKDKVPSWVIALVVIGASVCMALLLLGCFAMVWYIYKKAKYAFSPGNSLPQHLKEFLGYPPHSPLLFFTFPPADECEVFDKLSVVLSDVPGDKQPSPADGWRPPEPSQEVTHDTGHMDSPRTPTPESDDT